MLPRLGGRSGIGDGCNVSECVRFKERDNIAVNQGRESLTEDSVTNKIELLSHKRKILFSIR